MLMYSVVAIPERGTCISSRTLCQEASDVASTCQVVASLLRPERSPSSRAELAWYLQGILGISFRSSDKTRTEEG
jgi:hypothetical protein